jgi:N-acetylglucosamine-6-phosphate deacetylase
VRPSVFAAERVVTPGRDLVPGYLETSGGVITAVRPGTPRSARAIRFDGTLVPGLIDLQVNGAPHQPAQGGAGVDFLTCRETADLRRAKALLASGGVTSFLPTLISSPLPELLAAIQRWREFAEVPGGPAVLGLHLEGPYLNPAYAGAHDRAALRSPDPAEGDALLNVAPGLVKMVTLAPELPHAVELITTIRAAGTVVALGHTAATAGEADEAFDAGATVVTHLFNAMRPLHHRDPGIIGAALRRPGVTVGLIADLVHVHPAVLSLVMAVKGWRRIALISDAVAAHALNPNAVSGSGPDGRSAVLGSRRLEVTDAPRLDTGTLAGTTLLLGDAVRNLVSVGAPLRNAVLMASAVPAAVLGLPDRGRLAARTRADFAVLDPSLRPVATFVRGIEVFSR